MGDAAEDGGRTPAPAAATLDGLALELRALRESQGVSYREIATRITRRREQDGVAPAAAVVAHTTVSDVFRLGRARINADLVAEIVRALGGGEDEAAAWRERCVQAMTARRATEPAAPQQATVPAPQQATVPAVRRGWSGSPIVVLLVAALIINATGEFVNPLIGDLLFLDMIGTAVTAILLGPWWAALVGVMFIVVELLKGDVGHALFAITMVTSGLIWGYGVHKLDLGRTLPRFIGLSAAVALTTSLIAVPIIVLYFGGFAGRGLDGVITWVTAFGTELWTAVGVSNLTVSLVDKILTGVIAYFVAPFVGGLLRLPSDAVGSSRR